LKIDGKDFTLTARADRIDRLTDGTLRIIDYKTGTLPTQKAVDDGYAPQLPLEASLAAQGAFAGCKAYPVSELIFVRLSGGQSPGEICRAGKRSPAELAAAAHSGLLQLLHDYASPTTPYVALDSAERQSEPGDAGHLARTREWLYSLSNGNAEHE
jgi:ATP-dependent helicase/nuclease subunit B